MRGEALEALLSAQARARAGARQCGLILGLCLPPFSSFTFLYPHLHSFWALVGSVEVGPERACHPGARSLALCASAGQQTAGLPSYLGGLHLSTGSGLAVSPPVGGLRDLPRSEAIFLGHHHCFWLAGLASEARDPVPFQVRPSRPPARGPLRTQL